MSKQNVEIVRNMLAAFNAEDVDAFRAVFDRHVIMRMAEGWPEPGPFMGREAVMREIDQLRDTWDADALRPIGDFVDHGDRVLVRLIWRGVGRGPQSDMEFSGVYTLRNGSVIAIDQFWDHSEALKAVGLEG
jgi:ketosteroid isomerase-like protein